MRWVIALMMLGVLACGPPGPVSLRAYPATQLHVSCTTSASCSSVPGGRTPDDPVMRLFGGDYDHCTLASSVSVTVNGTAAEVVDPGTPRYVASDSCTVTGMTCGPTPVCQEPTWRLPAHGTGPTDIIIRDDTRIIRAVAPNLYGARTVEAFAPPGDRWKVGDMQELRWVPATDLVNSLRVEIVDLEGSSLVGWNLQPTAAGTFAGPITIIADWAVPDGGVSGTAKASAHGRLPRFDLCEGVARCDSDQSTASATFGTVSLDR
ncbi:MAG: hypothetical protein ACYC8T_26425 [Myxococcaceae bacterium]